MPSAISRAVIASTLFFVALGCTDSPQGQAHNILLLASPDPEAAQIARGARLAAAQVSEEGVLGKGLEVTGRALPEANVDQESKGHLAVLTVGAAKALTRRAGREADLPWIELRDDVTIGAPSVPEVFQVAARSLWQAEKLARYFGPEDRRYTRVGLARMPGPAGDALASDFSRLLAAKQVELVDSPGKPDAVLSALARSRPQAVVVQGSHDFIEAVAAQLSAPARRYRGRGEIESGWRPQLAGFTSLLSVQRQLPAGSVAAADYAVPFREAARLRSVSRFRKDFSAEHGVEPVGAEWVGYEAVRVLAEAVRRAGAADPDKIVAALESMDRVRFGHLPVSFGPDDHIVSERDLQGVWAMAPRGRTGPPGWRPLMRTFTSDGAGSNFLKEDWRSFFAEADPRGDPPPYEKAKAGITSGPDDDLA